MVLRKSRCLGKGAPLNGAPAKIIFCVESEKNMEYNPINALKMKSFSGYSPKKPYRWGMRLAYFACPYPYVFVKRECPRDAKLFSGITENKKT